MRILVSLALIWLTSAPYRSLLAAPPEGHVEQLRVRVLAEFPHDQRAFTQGLVWHDGSLYESTGLYGSSSVRQVVVDTGAIARQHRLDSGFFGEGLAVENDRFVQLTWYAGLALVYDADLLPVGQLDYDGEGWGLTWDGEHFVMSNGTPELTFRSPKTFEPKARVIVNLRGRPVGQLNELEYAEGAIFANVWQKEWIARIDPETGRVTAVIDASGLLSPLEKRQTDVLNGIAYEESSQTFWITGKYWPKLFQVAFEPVP